MKIHLNKLVLPCAAVALMLSSVGKANAEFFQISNITIVGGSGIGDELPGSGPGHETGVGGGGLLGVDAAVTDPTPATFNLSTVGDTHTFTAATYNFNSAETFITVNEGTQTPTHDLGFTLSLDFANPAIGLVDLALIGTTNLGRVRDTANNGAIPELDDYILSFVPVVQNFGGGGSFLITVTSTGMQPGFKGLANNADVLNLDVTIELLSAVPEPASMTLLGLGGIAVVAAGYRRRRTQQKAAV